MLKKIIFTLAALTCSQTVMANVCKDDPRMYTIKKVINKLHTGEAIKPLKITPHSFLNLPPAIRAALGDNVMVYNNKCVPVEIYKSTPPKKIAVAFEDLSNYMHHAAIRDDLIALNIAMTSFKAALKTTDEIVALVSPLNWTTSAINTMYKNGFLKRLPQVNLYRNNTKKYCKGEIALPSSINLFTLLGGKTSDKSKTSFIADSSDMYIQTINGVRADNSIAKTQDTCSGLSIAATHNDLVQTGINIVEYGGSNAHLHNSTKIWLNSEFGQR